MKLLKALLQLVREARARDRIVRSVVEGYAVENPNYTRLGAFGLEVFLGEHAEHVATVMWTIAGFSMKMRRGLKYDRRAAHSAAFNTLRELDYRVRQAMEGEGLAEPMASLE